MLVCPLASFMCLESASSVLSCTRSQRRTRKLQRRRTAAGLRFVEPWSLREVKGFGAQKGFGRSIPVNLLVSAPQGPFGKVAEEPLTCLNQLKPFESRLRAPFDVLDMHPARMFFKK